MPDGDDWTPVGVAGALASAYARDSRGFVPLLAAVLEGALPEETQTERRRGLFSKPKPAHKVTVALGDTTYSLEDLGHGPLAAQRVKIVRGIVLKTETLPIEDWLGELSAHVADQAGRSERAFLR